MRTQNIYLWKSAKSFLYSKLSSQSEVKAKIMIFLHPFIDQKIIFLVNTVLINKTTLVSFTVAFFPKNPNMLIGQLSMEDK